MDKLKKSIDIIIKTGWRRHRTENECFYDFGGFDDGVAVADIISYFQTKFPDCRIKWSVDYLVDYDSITNSYVGKSGILVKQTVNSRNSVAKQLLS